MGLVLNRFTLFAIVVIFRWQFALVNSEFEDEKAADVEEEATIGGNEDEEVENEEYKTKFLFYHPGSNALNIIKRGQPHVTDRLGYRFPFNSSVPLRVIIHDIDEYYFSPSCVRLGNHYRTLGDYNVLVVGYPSGKIPYSGVGVELARVLQQMNQTAGLQLNTTSVIGFGLGAHIAASAGKWFFYQSDYKIGMIVALDPPRKSRNLDHITWLDAESVVVFHTNVNRTGTFRKTGTVDIYANNQIMQPGCESHLCSHKKALEYFLNISKYTLLRCSGVPVAQDDRCFMSDVLATVPNEMAFKDKLSGHYWLDTVPKEVKLDLMTKWWLFFSDSLDKHM